MAAPGAGGQQLPASRTQFQFVASSGATPARWAVATDSVVAKALKFLGWIPDVASTQLEAPRHSVAGALLIHSTAPLAADQVALDGLNILEDELDAVAGAGIAHILDKGSAFSKEYNTYDAWAKARKAILAQVPDSDKDGLQLKA